MKTKKMRQMRQRKLINIRDEWEMMNNGLVNVLNILSTEHRKVSNFKNNRRSLIETFKETHNKTVSKNFRKSIFKLNITEVEMCSKMSVIESMRDIPLPYLLSKIDDKAIQVGLETSEDLTTEKSEHKVVARELTRTEIILNTRVIREIRATEFMDHG